MPVRRCELLLGRREQVGVVHHRRGVGRDDAEHPLPLMVNVRQPEEAQKEIERLTRSNVGCGPRRKSGV
jgi:hypothetical protein